MAPNTALRACARSAHWQQQLRTPLCRRCFYASESRAQGEASSRGETRWKARARRIDVTKPAAKQSDSTKSEAVRSEAQASVKSQARKPSSRQQRAAKASQSIEAIAQQGRAPNAGKDSKQPPNRSDRKQDHQRNPFNEPNTVPTAIPKITNNSLLFEGAGTATIAGSKFSNVVQDRLQLVTRPGVSTDQYSHDAIGQRKRPELKGEELEEWKKSQARIAGQRARRLGRLFVEGKYDPESLLGREVDAAKSTMDIVNRVTLMNPTYLREDADRFAAKVKSLLPVATRTRPTKAA